MPTTTLKTKEEVVGKRKELRSKIKELLTSNDGLTAEQYDEIATWNKELDALASLISVFNEEAKDKIEAEAEAEAESKDVDGSEDLVTDAPFDFGFDIKSWNKLAKGGAAAVKAKRFGIDTKKFLLGDAATTRTTWSPESTRFRSIVLQPLRQPSLLDALPKVQVNQMAAVYVRQNSQTNTVATRAEGADAAEQEFASTQISETIPMVSAFTEVTGEEVEDEASIMGVIRNRLPLLARVAVDNALITGAKAVTGINSTRLLAATVILGSQKYLILLPILVVW